MDQKITFLIIGTQKGGTTVLDYYLRQHPEIGMGNEKELHFFDNDALFLNPEVDYNHFTSRFTFSQLKKIYGEATPIYMYWEPCIKRIKAYNPHMNLIIVLRNPVERAFSHWNMEMERKAETESFLYCIQHETERLQQEPDFQHRVRSYVNRGFYAKQVKKILEHFDRDQLLFIKYEEFAKNEEQTLNMLFDFLQVSHAYEFKHTELNKRQYKTEITSDEKNYLLNLFEPDIVELEKILDWDCTDWKSNKCEPAIVI